MGHITLVCRSKPTTNKGKRIEYQDDADSEENEDSEPKEIHHQTQNQQNHTSRNNH